MRWVNRATIREVSDSTNNLSTLWERRTIRTALVFSGVAFAPLAFLAFALRPTGKPLWLTLPIAAILRRRAAKGD